MVAVPAHRAGDVQGNLREEGQQRRDLIADHLSGMVVAVVHQGDALAGIHGGVAQGKLRTAHGVALHADTEHLAFDAGLDELCQQVDEIDEDLSDLEGEVYGDDGH